MVNPGGTGSLSTDVISARLAPLPPRRSLSSMGGWACVWSKSKTNGIGPPCPVRAHRVGERGSLEVIALPTWDRRGQPTFLPTLLRSAGRRCVAVSGSPSGRPASPATAPLTWRWKTSLAWRMKSRTTASSSALKCWATWRISSATGCCRPAKRSWAAGTISTQTRRRSSVSRRRATMPASSRRSRMKVTAPVVRPLSSASRPAVSGPWLADQLQAPHVGPAQLQLLGHAVVELGGGAEVAHDLGAQLLAQLRARPLS